MNTVKNIVKEEGFRSKPYKDSKGILTFGHGLTYITEEESLNIVSQRVSSLEKQIDNILKQKNISLLDVRKSILVQMAYQMGVNGLLGFKKMWLALERKDYVDAAKEMLDSQWAKSDSPARANRAAIVMREGNE